MITFVYLLNILIPSLPPARQNKIQISNWRGERRDKIRIIKSASTLIGKLYHDFSTDESGSIIDIYSQVIQESRSPSICHDG